MRLAQMVDSLNWGGAQRMLLLLAEQLIPLGADITVISLRKKANSPVPDELRRLGARVVIVPVRRILDPAGFARLCGRLRQERFDVLHTHLLLSNALGPVAGWLTGTPAITFVHNVRYAVPAMKQGVETWAMRWTAKQVVACGYMAGEITERRVRRPVISLPNAVAPNPGLTAAEREAARAEVAGDPARPLIISVGRLSAAKGFPDLLAAFARVRDCHPRAALAIVGDGVLAGQLNQRVDAFGLRGHAFLLGLRDDVPRLMAAADLYVNASHWEGLPVTILEAMAAGLPVVATAVGDAPRVVVPGTGLLVPPAQPEQLAEAICDLLARPDDWPATGRAAREHIRQNYEPAQWRRNLLKIYAQVTPAAQPLLDKAA